MLHTRAVGWEDKAMGGKKPWNYSGSGRKSAGSRILPGEMLSLELNLAVIRDGLCHRDPGGDSAALSSADALLEKSKSLRKQVSSACEDGSVIEQSLFSHCKGICTLPVLKNICPPLA